MEMNHVPLVVQVMFLLTFPSWRKRKQFEQHNKMKSYAHSQMNDSPRMGQQEGLTPPEMRQEPVDLSLRNWRPRASHTPDDQPLSTRRVHSLQKASLLQTIDAVLDLLETSGSMG
jgi:hypothetical protein